MTLSPSNISLLLALASSIAPGTWALVAGVAGAAVGFFGKQIYDRSANSNNSSTPGKIPRRNAARRAANPSGRKKGAPSRRN
jgi:hypothetical protein